MSTTQPKRILAVEIRAARLGYAVFETPKTLRDFGAAWFDSNMAARSRIARLLRLCRPTVLVLRGASRRYIRRSRARRAVVQIAGQEARKLAIPITRITEQEFKSYFARQACRDKYDVARLLAGRFPETAWRLPERPKFFEPEPRAILYFDSIALAAAYLELANIETTRADLSGG